MNRKYLRLIALLLTMVLMVSLAACGNTDEESVEQSSEETQQEETAETSDDTSNGGVLVVYFSATGTTKGVAETIAQVTGADIHEIVPAQEYTEADLDYNDSESRTTKEQDDKTVRPEIAGDDVDLTAYSVIYIGYPIWWGEEPRIMDTFVESHDFDGKTVIPFCTSGGSGIGSSGKNLETNAGSGTWLDGQRLEGGVSEDEIQSWIDELGL